MHEEQVNDIRARDKALSDWLKANNTNSYRREELPAHLSPPTNEERSACEVFEFMRDKPDRYFLYIKEAEDMTTKPGWRNFGWGQATTWTGENLGRVSFGRAWRDNFGGTRIPVTVFAINGETYHGTYFISAGQYARVKKAKK